MEKPLISIVLCSYNRLPFLKLALQNFREELEQIKTASMPRSEIIVVDGGSNDGSLEWLCQQKDIITIVQHNRGTWNGKNIERRSWGYFMNLAFKTAQGQYVCMLSDDCLLVPGALVHGLQLIQKQRSKNINVGAVAFYFRDWSRDTTYHVGYTLGEKMYVNHGIFLNQALKEVDYIDEERYLFYNADGDLCLKMWQKGYLIIDSPNSYVEHYPHANVTVRKTNYSKFKQDLHNYFEKWNGIFYNRSKNNCGKIVEKYFDDTTQTGVRFESLHKEVVKQHPNIVKESLFSKINKQFRWKYRALKKKIFTSLFSKTKN
ncbi:MAG: glycosyltransferase [bacterium]